MFVDGERSVTLRGAGIATEFIALIDAYVEKKYARGIAGGA